MKNYIQPAAIAILALSLLGTQFINDQQGKSLARIFSEQQHQSEHITELYTKIYDLESELSNWEIVEEDPFTISGAIVENLEAGGCLTDPQLWEIQQSNLSEEQKNHLFEMDMRNSGNGCGEIQPSII